MSESIEERLARIEDDIAKLSKGQGQLGVQEVLTVTSLSTLKVELSVSSIVSIVFGFVGVSGLSVGIYSLGIAYDSLLLQTVSVGVCVVAMALLFIIVWKIYGLREKGRQLEDQGKRLKVLSDFWFKKAGIEVRPDAEREET